MMKSEASIFHKMLEDNNSEIDLNTYSEVDTERVSIDKYFSLLDEYNVKHSNTYFDYSAETNIVKKNNPLISTLFNSISALKPGEFEKLSAIVCKCMGYEYFKATQPTHDQGIDFLARKDIQEITTIRKDYIFGQSKHFGNKLVKTMEIRELAGSVYLFKRKEFALKGTIYVGHDIKSFTSVKVFFITSYFFSDPAQRLCNRTNILHFDIVDVICICIGGLNKGLIDWFDASKKFDQTKFDEDLANIEIESN